jgi:hypothetical protein
MQWSRLKKSIEQRFAESLQDRVQIHTTRYGRKGETGRFWIVFDKQQIFSAANCSAWAEESRTSSELRNINGCTDYRDPAQKEQYYQVYWQTKFLLHQRGTFSRYECEEALIEYLNLSIEEALQSENIFINALAMFDSRLGKRRLAFLASDKSRHPLVSKFYQPGQDAVTQTQQETVAISKP